MITKLKSYVLAIIILSSIVLLNNCKKANEDDPPTDGVIISEESKVIEKATWDQSFIAIDSSNFTLSFSKNDAIEKINVGDIIVSGVGEGLLRRVTSVETSDNEIILRTAQATLTELIQQGLIDFEQQLTIPQIKSIDYHYSGVVLDTLNYKNGNETQFSWDINAVLYDEDGNMQTTGDQIKVAGDFSCDWNIIAKIDIGLIEGLKEVKFGFNSNENLNLQLIAGSQYNFEKSYTLATVNFTPILVTVGFVPLVFTPKFKIIVGVDGYANASITTGITQGVEFESGMQYLKASGWSTYQSFNNNFDFQPPQVNLNAGAEAYLKPELTLMLYSVAGPYANLKLNGELDADILGTPMWKLYAGLNMAAGVKVEILDRFILDFTVSDLISYEHLIAQGGTSTFVDPRDGQEYKIVTIGNQTWFAENLNYETTNSWWYENSSANGNIYGRLYTWGTAVSACPAGWHLPLDDEWATLVNHLGGPETAGGKMKEAGTVHWNSPNVGATNESGFNGLPGGFYYHHDGTFSSLGGIQHWWSSAANSSEAYAWAVLFNFESIERIDVSTAYGFAVRCIKD